MEVQLTSDQKAFVRQAIEAGKPIASFLSAPVASAL